MQELLGNWRHCSLLHSLSVFLQAFTGALIRFDGPFECAERSRAPPVSV